jgi:hypothetical protein
MFEEMNIGIMIFALLTEKITKEEPVAKYRASCYTIRLRFSSIWIYSLSHLSVDAFIEYAVSSILLHTGISPLSKAYRGNGPAGALRL